MLQPNNMRSDYLSIKCVRLGTPLGRFLFLLCSILFVFLICAAVSYAATQKRVPATQRPYVINNRLYSPLPSAIGYEEYGIASWYGSDFHGNATSNGETYNMHDISAAHKLLPMHTMLLVTNLDNGKEIVVRVNDRGPFIQGRIIDLSYGAAQKIALVNSGTARVKITALGELSKNKPTGQQHFINHADLRSGEYYVQIGAFTQKYNGIELQERFLDAGHRVVMKKAKINGQIFYRVQVYVGRTLNSARRSEQALLDKGYKDAFVLAR
jgi:peptidoglycan lytic transglycosylase